MAIRRATKKVVAKKVAAKKPAARKKAAAKKATAKKASAAVKRVAARRAAAKKTAKSAPKIPSIEDYIGADVDFLATESDLMKALEMFKVDLADQQGDVEQAFQRTMERMGYEKEKSLKNIEADFAGRNMLYSGLYGKGVGDYNTQYQQAVSDLEWDKGNQLDRLQREENQMQSLYGTELQNARLDATRRRAEQYGIGNAPAITAPKNRLPGDKYLTKRQKARLTPKQQAAQIVKRRRVLRRRAAR